MDGVEELPYLGSIQASSGRSHPDIFKRIGISSAAMHAFHTVWRQRELSLATKLRLYQSCILSILLYGSESWTLLKEDLRRLERIRTEINTLIFVYHAVVRYAYAFALNSLTYVFRKKQNRMTSDKGITKITRNMGQSKACGRSGPAGLGRQFNG